LSEGIPALSWVGVSPTPAPFVNEARASSEFYSNKLLVEFKGKDENQTNWVHQWNNFLKGLAAYVKKNHTTGLTWNPRGGDAASASAGAAPKAGGPPPPPSGPPPPPAGAPPAVSGKPAADTGALFAALNSGDAVTKTLKKVTKEMKTSNRADKSSVVPAEIAPKKEAAPKGAKQEKKGTPKFELSGNKWIVEWQENNQVIEINETEAKQTVYIYKCDKVVVKIAGKINAVTVDNCKKTSVVFNNAIASCEVVNSTGVEVQVLGKVPSIAIDKSSAIQLYLSKDSLEAEIVTSKTDAFNILIPDPSGNPDPLEIAVPEQFKTLVKNGKLVTTAVEHKG